MVEILVHTSDGLQILLSQVTKIKKVTGPIQINRENNQRRWIIAANVRGRDIGGVVADIQKEVRNKIILPLSICQSRHRWVLMTAITTILGLLPLLLSHGLGSEVQRPLEVVIVFGLISSTFLTLILIPVLYEWFALRLSVAASPGS